MVKKNVFAMESKINKNKKKQKWKLNYYLSMKNQLQLVNTR